MKREQFTVAVREETGPPSLDIAFDGPAEALSEQFGQGAGETVEEGDVDAAFRLVDRAETDEQWGVFSLTHRLTGSYLLEVNVQAAALSALVATARDDDGTYRVRIARNDGESATGEAAGNDADDEDLTTGDANAVATEDPIVYDLEALLVYDGNGDLLRERSLIPSGVEL
mgnify:CR=1 FL=1